MGREEVFKVCFLVLVYLCFFVFTGAFLVVVSVRKVVIVSQENLRAEPNKAVFIGKTEASLHHRDVSSGVPADGNPVRVFLNMVDSVSEVSQDRCILL